MARLVVIGFDGSADACHAIEIAASCVRAQHAVIVNVWHGALASPEVAVPHVPPAALPLEADAELERRAHEVAEAGVALAHEAGMSAEPEVRHGDSARAIAARLLEVARERD